MWGKDRGKDLNATLAAMTVPNYRDTLSRLEAESIDRAVRQLVSALHTTSHFSSNPDSPFDRLEQTMNKMKADTQILAIRGDVAAHVQKDVGADHAPASPCPLRGALRGVLRGWKPVGVVRTARSFGPGPVEALPFASVQSHSGRRVVGEARRAARHGLGRAVARVGGHS